MCRIACTDTKVVVRAARVRVESAGAVSTGAPGGRDARADAGGAIQRPSTRPARRGTEVRRTGWFAADAANVKPGATVVVVGDGAVGLLGVLSARQEWGPSGSSP